MKYPGYVGGLASGVYHIVKLGCSRCW